MLRHLEFRLSCTNPSIWDFLYLWHNMFVLKWSHVYSWFCFSVHWHFLHMYEYLLLVDQWASLLDILCNTENKSFSVWQLCHHWWDRKLPIRHYSATSDNKVVKLTIFIFSVSLQGPLTCCPYLCMLFISDYFVGACLSFEVDWFLCMILILVYFIWFCLSIKDFFNWCMVWKELIMIFFYREILAKWSGYWTFPDQNSWSFADDVSKAFSWMKIMVFCCTFHRSFFLGI